MVIPKETAPSTCRIAREPSASSCVGITSFGVDRTADSATALRQL